MEPCETPFVGFWDRPQGELLGLLRATATGLTSDEAKIFLPFLPMLPTQILLNDFLMFGILFWVFHASTNAPLFRVVAIAEVLPYTPPGSLLRFVPLPSRCWPRSRTSP
jgi:hypothetical protein